MATTTSKKPGSKKPGSKKPPRKVTRPPRKQTEIDGTERVIDTELSDAAERLHSIRARRMALTVQETEAADELLELMKTKHVDQYIDEDLELRAVVKHGSDKVSVTKIKPKGDIPAEAAEAAE